MCECEELDSNPFTYSKDYGWLIHWVEFTKDHGYAQIHEYGIAISYCPLCGKKLENKSYE